MPKTRTWDELLAMLATGSTDDLPNCLRARLAAEMHRHNDPATILGTSLSDGEMDHDLDVHGLGLAEFPWQLWTIGRIYFPVIRDGQMTVASLERHPSAAKAPTPTDLPISL